MHLLTVVGQPGLHHNFLRYILDYNSRLTPVLEGSPFKDTGTSHADINYSGSFKIIQGRGVEQDDTGPFVICVADDLHYFERASISREGDRNNDLLDHANFKNWQPWNSHYTESIIKQYKIHKDDVIPKFILRDSIKQSYLDINNKGFYIENKSKIESVKRTSFDNYYFPVSAFFTLEKFIKELGKLDVKYNLQLDLDSVVPKYREFARKNRILNTHSIVYEILYAIDNKTKIQIPELDVFQEGYIYAVLEQKNDFVLMPMVNRFFSDTHEIIDYLKYYPNYYKAMNPNLPTFNGMPNPYYLAKLKK